MAHKTTMNLLMAEVMVHRAVTVRKVAMVRRVITDHRAAMARKVVVIIHTAAAITVRKAVMALTVAIAAMGVMAHKVITAIPIATAARARAVLLMAVARLITDKAAWAEARTAARAEIPVPLMATAAAASTMINTSS